MTEKRRVKRTWLEQFPCPYVDGPTKMCKADCGNATGQFDECQVIDVYRQAIADAKCAWLLREFDAQYLELLRDAYGKVVDPTFRKWINLSNLVRRIRDALGKAGLL